MRRRRFLKGSVAVAGLAAAPGLIRSAFADTSAVKPKIVPTAIDLDGARAHARVLGRPLMVIVVPAGSDRALRGQAWGSFLMHADVADFNLLALAEVVCAPMSEVSKVAPNITGEPWAVLLEADRPARAFDGVVPPRAVINHRRNDGTVDKSIDREIAALGKLIRDGFKADAAELERLAARVPLSADERRKITDSLASGTPDADTGERSAPLVMLAARRGASATRQRISRGIERALIRRLRDEAPAGSRWDKVWDCPPCGMAVIPPKSGRFLTFFVKGEPPPPKSPFGE